MSPHSQFRKGRNVVTSLRSQSCAGVDVREILDDVIKRHHIWYAVYRRRSYILDVLFRPYFKDLIVIDLKAAI